MLNTPPSRAVGSRIRPARCRTAASPIITCMLTPVAPTRMALGLRLPETLIGSLPSRSTQPSRIARSLRRARSGHRLVLDQLGRGEAHHVGLDERQVEQVNGPGQRLLQGQLRPSNLMIPRLLIGRKSLTCVGGGRRRLFEAERRADVGQGTTAAGAVDTGEQSVRLSVRRRTVLSDGVAAES